MTETQLASGGEVARHSCSVDWANRQAELFSPKVANVIALACANRRSMLIVTHPAHLPAPH